MGDRDIKDGTRAVTQRHGWAVPSATASGARATPMLQNATPCGPTSRSAGENATKEERDRIRAWGRSSVQRSVRIDARNGDRLGSGGYEDHDAPGYLLKGRWAVDARGAVGIAAPWGPEPRAA